MTQSDISFLSITHCVTQTPSTGLQHPSLNHCVFSYATGSRKLSANKLFFFFGAQTVVSLLQTTQIISDICFITDHVAYTSSNKAKILSIEMELFFLFFTRGGCASCLRTCLGARLLPQSYEYPNLSEDANHIECPFSSITKSGRVWRKVPESDARSVCVTISITL